MRVLISPDRLIQSTLTLDEIAIKMVQGSVFYNETGTNRYMYRNGNFIDDTGISITVTGAFFEDVGLNDWVYKASKFANAVNKVHKDPKLDEFVTFINTLDFIQQRRIRKIMKYVSSLD